MKENSLVKLLELTGSKIATHFQERMFRKNCEYVFPRLRAFLLDVLKSHNQELGLHIQDLSALSQSSCSLVNNSIVRYRFEIVATEYPHYDSNTYKQILQAYCNQNASTYGAYGLNVMFQNVFSIFIERVFFAGSTITVDVIYISDQKSYMHCKKIVQNDIKVLKNKKTVGRLLKILSK